MAKKSFTTGAILAGAGFIFGIGPLAISFAAEAFGSDIGNVLSWYTFFTAPVGAVVVIVGLIIAIVGANTSASSDFVKASASGASAATQPDTAGSLPPLSPGLARSVKLAYAVGFGVVLVSCVMRVTLFQPDSGILTFFDLIPAFFAGWFVLLARKSDDGLRFLRLVRSQMIVSIAGCVAGIYPLIYLADDISFLGNAEGDDFQLGGTIITGLIPLAASIGSLVFAGVARARYRASMGND
jgi:hypothetical protein